MTSYHDRTVSESFAVDNDGFDDDVAKLAIDFIFDARHVRDEQLLC